MFVEGIVNKEFLTLMEATGVEIELKINNTEEAIHAYEAQKTDDKIEIDFTIDAWVRVYVDEDIETLWPNLVDELPAEELSLWIGCKNKNIVKAIERRLKSADIVKSLEKRLRSIK